MEDEHALDSKRLAVMDGPALQALLGRKSPMPLQDERARLLREVSMLQILRPVEVASCHGSAERRRITCGQLALSNRPQPDHVVSHEAHCAARIPDYIACPASQVGRGLLEGFGGQAAHLVHAAQRSAARLVTLLTAAFPGFRDHGIYRYAP